MAEYIKRDDALDAWYDKERYADIEAIPLADVVERKKGKWESYCLSNLTYKYRCSLCKCYHRARYDYCPSCGAEMVGEV